MLLKPGYFFHLKNEMRNNQVGNFMKPDFSICEDAEEFDFLCDGLSISYSDRRKRSLKQNCSVEL